KEVFGVFDLEDRFVYVSDGGHLENFGLLELLGRRCAVILCCDASGDAYDARRGPTSVAGTLRHALRMARDRLGVTIEAVPASGAPFAVDLEDDAVFAAAVAPFVPTLTPPPGCERLRGKLAADCVATFRIAHPGVPGAPPALLRVPGAAPTPEVSPAPPLEPARLAATDFRDFPNNSTVDQWLTTEQFDGYVALGRHVAARARARLAELHQVETGEPSYA